MDYYSNQISKLIDELSRCKVSIQTGISSDTYAERRSETSGRHYGRGKRKCTLLQRMLHPDGSGTLPNL